MIHNDQATGWIFWERADYGNAVRRKLAAARLSVLSKMLL